MQGILAFWLPDPPNNRDVDARSASSPRSRGARLACGEEMPSDRDVVLVRFVLVQLTLPLNPFDLHLQDDNGAKHGLPFSGLHRPQLPSRLRQEPRFDPPPQLLSLPPAISQPHP